MKIRFIVLVLLSIVFTLEAQKIRTPLEESGWGKLTTYTELVGFLEKIQLQNKYITMEYFASSAMGRKIPVIKISKGEFGRDSEKIKVLIFAQQHGNEPSGKEGALLLLSAVAAGELDDILNEVDVAIVPMMNPDGNEVNSRRNGNNADLNRDHLIMLQPETQGLHNFFNKYMFEASMDVHEYSPYSQSWIEYGYLKNADETVGTLTNINISLAFRKYQLEKYMPFIQTYINAAGFSFEEYLPGGPPETDLIRRSTYDINDGRQSLGSLGTFSFIQEGLNGKDSLHRIERRSKGQFTGMKGFLQYIYDNKSDILSLVKTERINNQNAQPEYVALQMTHALTGEERTLTLLSLAAIRDTTIKVKNYRPVVKTLYSLDKPRGYLIPENDSKLTEWVKHHGFRMEKYIPGKSDKIVRYKVNRVDSIDFEGDVVVNPDVAASKILPENLQGNYYFLPANQLAGNVIMQALEPKSILGLFTYKHFEYLLVEDQPYPVLRVNK